MTGHGSPAVLDSYTRLDQIASPMTPPGESGSWQLPMVCLVGASSSLGDRCDGRWRARHFDSVV